MKMTVNVNFTHAPDALGELWRAFTVYEFNPENRIECKDGKVSLTLVFESTPPLQMMYAISKGVITDAIYGETCEVKENADKKDEVQKADETHNVVNNVGQEIQPDSESTEGVSSKVQASESNESVSSKEQDGTDAEGIVTWDFSCISDNLKTIHSLEEIAETLGLNEKGSKLFVQIVEVSCEISGRITWEKITKAFKEKSIKFGVMDKNTITKAVEAKYSMSTIKMLKIIAKVVNEAKETCKNSELVSESKEQEYVAENVEGEGTKLGSPVLVNQNLPVLTCIRAKLEEVPEVFVNLENRLRELSRDETEELEERVRQAMGYFNFGTDYNNDKLIDMICFVMKRPTISFNENQLGNEFGSVMMNRVFIANMVRDKMMELGLGNIIVTSEEFLTDLRDMIMSEEELGELVE